MKPDLVIFDCDGVLVDSETISLAALMEVIEAAGGRIGEDTAYRLFLGRSMATVRDVLETQFGLLLADEALEGLRGMIFQRFRERLQAMPGVAQAIRRLGCAVCVASSSQPDRIRLSLGLTGLLELLEPHLYSAAMVSRGKPAPDLFLHAARAMGAEPERCLVIEDSPAGVEAARAASMRVFAFAGGSHAANGLLRTALETVRPDLIFDDMRQLPGLVAALGRKAS